ncbi:glycosyltransferase family 2 protein [Patescibacteria group bacterium]|nr:glycosyltransferase family 2 protein [Patescibacteria group bacterium]MBU1034602.1 glycosyltransferase family 2 protein [Patescibacteria group bacterium]MBU1629635.1 glycosyltransferase family 2 protein [Patescibacteria group bacterium]MBU1908330.1 glycosyltransferase family 2 protein [Patescibacteria group bacterium]
MKDLRIIIVSWNVERLLERCLKSLPTACAGLDWEAIMADNASNDGSVEMAEKCAQELNGRLHIIANKDNRGFAKACNQGISGYDARYVLLLNPDTECPPDSLLNLVKAADNNPKAGIFGPQLIYPDGKHQPSVRRFPTVWNQIGILLKLHHLLPWLFKNYFNPLANDKDKIKVDQVMGACFLIRRELIEQIGGLDERYFIWFEEVDYCKQAKQRGWEVDHEPFVTVIHHGGESFAQLFSTHKQRIFNDSLKKYFTKWHPGWRARLISLVCPVAILEAYIIERFFGNKRPTLSKRRGKR